MASNEWCYNLIKRALSPKQFVSEKRFPMKYLAPLSFLFFLVFGAAAQTNTGTRPRVVPTATPPKIVNEPSRPTASSAPPDLQGGSRSTLPSTATTPPPGKGDDEIIKVETNLVTMPVSVLDREGRFISGLQKNDFEIYENGVRQKVDYFQSVEQPFTVVMLIDVSPSTEFK